MYDRPQSIVDHLTELRRRIIYALLSVVAGISVAVIYSHRLLTYILETAREQTGITMIQYSFADTFLTEFKLAVITGLVLAFPLVLYQVIAFVLPALKPGERRLLFLGLPFATLLFLGGWSFGWFVVVPITRTFFLGVATSAAIQPMITPSAYLSFVMGICNPLGIAFELPLVVVILARIGLVSSAFLARIRKYAFLGLLVLAAVLSPPDVISMAIFLVPLYALYEFSILLARMAEPKDR